MSKLTDTLGEVHRLERLLRSVRDLHSLHVVKSHPFHGHCRECGQVHPCQTVRTLRAAGH